MAFYQGLKKYKKAKAQMIAARLLHLRASMDDRLLANREAGSLILGSWNIRAFDGGRPRRDESYHYIAEIIDKFDICAVQEIKQDLGPLKRLKRLLGPNWSYFVTDVTSGDAGNSERIAFLYNTNRVIFRSVIGELVLEKDNLIAGRQLARTPFFASFQAGWFKFTLCSAHIAFDGEKAGLTDEEIRVREIGAISKALAKRAKNEDEVYFFLGDMNIDKISDPTMKVLKKNGFNTPLFGETNLAGGKHFDQIAYTGEGKKTRFLAHGKVDWRTSVYRPQDRELYKPIAEKMRGKPYKKWKSEYRNWTSFEMSDHFPIWVEIKTDFSDDYLKRFLA